MDQFSFLDAMGVQDESDIVDLAAVDGIEVDPKSYDHVIVAFSGGKDSVACVLHLLDLGVKPELHHHDVDGRDVPLFDWPVTPAYCNAFAAALGLTIHHSWRIGGLRGELLRENERTKPVRFEGPDGEGQAGGIGGGLSTRRRFPALQASLMTRWCSAVAKIDPFGMYIANQERFRGKRILVVTGERAQESAARATYKTLEPHRSHAPGPRARRHVDHWRPIHRWTEKQVWAIMERHRIDAHPCYHLNFGRCSCLNCIFGSANQWATVRKLVPERFAELVRLEIEFEHTLRKGITLEQLADKGVPYDMDPEMIRVALATTYDRPIVVDEWTLPAGAYGESTGPL